MSERQIDTYREAAKGRALVLVQALKLGVDVESVKSRARSKYDLSVWFHALDDQKTLEYLTSPIKRGSMEMAMSNVSFLNGLSVYPEMRSYLKEEAVDVTGVRSTGYTRSFLAMGNSEIEGGTGEKIGLFLIEHSKVSPWINSRPRITAGPIDEDWMRDVWNGTNAISRIHARDLSRLRPHDLLKRIERQLRLG